MLSLRPDWRVYADGARAGLEEVRSATTIPGAGRRLAAGFTAGAALVVGLDQGGVPVTGTIMAVNHRRHLWGEWQAGFVIGFPLDAAGIRAEIAVTGPGPKTIKK